MGGFSSRPQAPPAEAPTVEEQIQRAPADTTQEEVEEEETTPVEAAIQRALANESTTELFIEWRVSHHPPPLTVIDSQCIIECLQQTPRINTLTIENYALCPPPLSNSSSSSTTCFSISSIFSMTLLMNCSAAFHDDAVLNILRDGLPLCTSITTVKLQFTYLTSEGLDRLRLAFHNTSVTKLDIHYTDGIEGRHGGEVLRDLLRGNDTLRELSLYHNPIGPEVAIGFGQGLADNHGLEILYLNNCDIGNVGLANLLPANLLPADDGSINNSLTKLYLGCNNIQGEDGGRQVSLLMLRFPALKVLGLRYNHRLGPLGARALAPGVAAATSQLEELSLNGCGLGNDGVANLILPDGQVNRSLTNLDLGGDNDIEGEDGGRQLSLLLQRFPALTVLRLGDNCLFGPLGVRALAPGLAAARHLESLDLSNCGLGNDGVANLVPDGQVNRSLTNLHLGHNGIEGLEGGENVIALVGRCTNLDSIVVDIADPDQQRRLGMLLERNRLLITEATSLGGSTFPVLFRFMKKAHHHEHGLSAIFVILQNDGDDYFCIALNRAID